VHDQFPEERKRMMIRHALFLLFLLCSSLPAADAAPEAGKLPPVQPDAGKEGLEIGRLVVYGDDMMFVIKEPKGWLGDMEKAKHGDAAVVLSREDKAATENGTTISVRVSRKVDENTKEDLLHDMQGFRERYPDAQFKDLKAKHPSFKIFPKIFSVPGKRYDYVTFLNPGKKVPFLFTVVMQTGQRTASKEELDAYREVVRSVEYISQEGVKPPEKAAP
jgi:hypothetical protein